MSAAEIVQWALRREEAKIRRRDKKTMHAALSRSVIRKSPTRFIKVSQGRFDLRRSSLV